MPESQAFRKIEIAAGLPPGIPGEVLTSLSARFLSAPECNEWFFRRYYPAGPCCPECRAAVVHPVARQNFLALKRFTCGACGQRFRATKGTLLQDSPLTPRDLVLLAALCGWGVEPREIARVVGIAPETVRAWRDKFIALAEVGH